MSEYNIQMNKYNALNAEYDQLYPQPMKHANTHAKDGSDPITPASIGAYTKTEADALLAKKMVSELGQAGANLLEWANAQAVGGCFYINPTVTTADVPIVTWYAGLLEINGAGRRMIISTSGGGSPITYVNVTSAGVWNGWQQLATAAELDTKVSKSGDTMTGTLKLTDNIGTSRIKGVKFGMYLCSDDLGSEQWQLFINRVADGTIGDSLTEALMLCRANAQDGWITTYPVLHTGNAQTLGFTKIATGSYVGTGTVGREHPTVLTFNFAPKFLILVKDDGALPDGTTLLSKVGAYSIYGYNGFYHFYTYSSGWACTLSGWGTNTLSYYANGVDATYQFNVSGNTYYYMALG